MAGERSLWCLSCSMYGFAECLSSLPALDGRMSWMVLEQKDRGAIMGSRPLSFDPGISSVLQLLVSSYDLSSWGIN